MLGLTHYGGSYFLHEFLRLLQLSFLARHLHWDRRNSKYSLAQMILARTSSSDFMLLTPNFHMIIS
jgi:hypothetical protein